MQASLNKTTRLSRGFTIVELMIIISVMTILLGLVMSSLYSYYTSNTTSLKKSTQDTDTRKVLRTIESELTNTSGWITSLAVARPLGPTNSTSTNETWSFCGTGGTANCTQSVNRVLIAYTNATDKAASDSTRLPVFGMTSGVCDYSKTIQVAQIYFVAADTSDPTRNNLYRRTVVNPDSSPRCNNVVPFQKTTCAVAVASQAGCLDSGGLSHIDAILLRGIKSFDVDYYAVSNDTSPITNQYSASASTIASSTTVKLSITTEVRLDGSPTTKTTDIRISRS